MVRKSFLEREIEMLAAAIARILFHKSVSDHAGALDEIHAAARKIAGLDARLLLPMTEDAAAALFSGGAEAGRCFALALLLGERADVLAAQGRAEEARACRSKALRLFAEALLAEPRLRTPENLARLREAAHDAEGFASEAALRRAREALNVCAGAPDLDA